SRLASTIAFFWHGETGAVHYGLGEPTARGARDELLNTNRRLADRARLGPGQDGRPPGAGSAAIAFETEAADQVVDVRAAEVGAARRLHDVPAVLLQRGPQELRLEATGRFQEGRRLDRRGDLGDLGEEVGPLDLPRPLAHRADHRRLDCARQLADVARPVGH